MRLAHSHEPKEVNVDYSTPKIVDYGTVQDLTAGCNGSPADFEGLNNALVAVTSKGTCISDP
jgi:hypothetical protein